MDKPPSIPDYGDIVALYAAIGRAISNWAKVEMHLFSLFRSAFGEEDPIAPPIFFAWRDFKSRLELTSSVILTRQDGKPEAIFWQSLMSSAKNLSIHRNFIAHNPVTLSIDEHGAKYAQVTGFFEALHGRKERLTKVEADINEMADTFNLLALEVSAFCLHLNGQRTLPDKFSRPLADPILANYDSWSPQQAKRKPPPQSSEA